MAFHAYVKSYSVDTQPLCDISTINRPLPSSKNAHFQNEAKCSVA